MHVVLPYMKHQFGYIIYAVSDNSLKRWNSLCECFVQHFTYQLIKLSKKPGYGTRDT